MFLEGFFINGTSVNGVDRDLLHRLCSDRSKMTLMRASLKRGFLMVLNCSDFQDFLQLCFLASGN